MAFVVEDGTGLAGATSYVEDSFFTSYHEDSGVDLSGFEQSDREAALVRATRYVDSRFRFIGTKKSSTQALAWPRWVGRTDPDGFDYEDVPTRLKQAVSIYAREALWSSLYPVGQLATPVVLPGTGGLSLSSPVRRQRSRVGLLEEEVEYSVATQGAGGALREIPEADALLRDLVTSGAAVYRG